MQRLRIPRIFSFQPVFLLVLAGVFIAVALAAWAAILTDSGANGAAAVWWSNAILLSALLLNKRKHWPAILATGYLANVAAHFLVRDPVSVCIGMSACDLLEVAISAYPFSRSTRGATNFSRLRELARLYLIGALIGPAISALCASALMYLLFGPMPLGYSIHWFASNALGAIVVTPVILSLFNRKTYSIFQRHRLLQSIALLGLQAVCAVLVFSNPGLPLLFLLFPPLLLVVVRLEMGGGMIGVSIIGVVATIFAVHGHVPMAQAHAATWQMQLFLMQVLLASAVLCVALVAAVLNERRHLERAARKSEQLYRLLAENSSDIIVLTDREHRRQYVSPAVRWMMGWEPQELLGTTFRDSIVHPDDVALVDTALQALRNGETAKAITYRCQKKDGAFLWVEANISLYCDTASGNPIGYVNVVRDIDERKAAEEKLQDAYLALEALAAIDALTGISNRRHFDATLAQEWRRAIRLQSPVSLLLLDVDHFKFYNDLYGHLRGDSCLRQIAEATLDVVHRSGDTVARFGGEEFGIILPGTTRQGALDMAEKIRLSVARRGLAHGANQPGIVTVSIGCATFIPQRGSNANVLIAAADHALYEAKRSGRNRVACAPDDAYSETLSKE